MWSGQLTLPPELKSGEYRLQLSLQQADGSILAELPLSEKDTVIVTNR
jgi:hypothetical protein